MNRKSEKKSEEKTSEKISAWAKLIDSISKVIWAIVILIILAAAGKYLIFKSSKIEKRKRVKPITQKSEEIWDKIDDEIVKSLKKARSEADRLANAEVDKWIEGMVERIDNDFLDWYFGYWNQQKLGLKGLWYGARHMLFKKYPSAAEKITEDIQEEFAKRVLRPQIAQREMENISRDVVNKYIAVLSENLSGIPQKYSVPDSEWDKYLSEIALTVTLSEGNREVPITLKTLAITSVGGTVVVGKALFKVIKPMIIKIGSKVSAKFAAKATAKMATKTGAKISAKIGGKFLGPIIGVGIIIWDIWDHNSTIKRERPILRKNLIDYFSALKESLLYDPESGIMSVVDNMENDILKSLRKRK